MINKTFCASLFMTAICVLTISAQPSPYISRVWEYNPAPGQFVNDLPAYEEGDDAEAMRRKAEEEIAADNQGMITLGGWGGYVVFGFDHMVPNEAGEYDLLVQGNAFYSGVGNEDDASNGGSCEPGIVMVSYDANGNGLPDDEWYELAGSEYDNPSVVHNYRLTYYAPAPNHRPVPSQVNSVLTDTTYIRWQDNRNRTGYMYQVAYHKQPYFPQWLGTDSVSFTGARLPDNAVDVSEAGASFVLMPYDWGYADNHPNKSEKARLKIDWAVDADGDEVNLPGIHFVKVYTAVHQQCGWIGETSTEITGAVDLHCHTALESVPSDGFRPRLILHKGNVVIERGDTAYTLDGRLVTK